MVEIESKGTYDYLEVLRGLGRSSLSIEPRLEHILITGMFNAIFQEMIHAMPLKDAERYLEELRAFYITGWLKIIGQ